MKNDHWETLLKGIKKGICTPFLGAAASHPPLPTASDLSEELVREWERRNAPSKCPLQAPQRADLAQVAQFLLLNHAAAWMSKALIADHIQACPAPNFLGDALEPHRILAKLPIPLYMTTNYDSFMKGALDVSGKQPKQEVARWTPNLLKSLPSAFDSATYQPAPDKPMVFHLHGCAFMSEEGLAAMVASEDDYLDFLVNLSYEMAEYDNLDRTQKRNRRRLILPLQIRNALTNNILLFIGYGLRDVNLRVILRALLGKQPSMQLRVAVQLDPGSREEISYLQEYFDKGLKLTVFWGTIREFMVELLDRWGKLYGAL
jgi:hypothetical protein